MSGVELINGQELADLIEQYRGNILHHPDLNFDEEVWAKWKAIFKIVGGTEE